ncbi:Putative cytochrome C-type biogenesis protein [hydrothermal vent metagenome]|uniref:Putative cytochrome C-type biogenesis protein n=1 Tax=hydrothermal vent metagenome TaxID=652676 RepID=A0A1W1CWW8_9ZZZZ
MKTLLSFVGSMKSMVVLMLIFAFAIGYATIVENDYGTMTAKAEIYNAQWFNVLLGLLAINLVYNIIHFKMYKVQKAPIFIFHVAFLVILFGAAVTRYMGYEGIMHIRNGMIASSMMSSDPYFNVEAKVGNKVASYSKIAYLSKRSHNDLEASLDVAGKDVDVELKQYIPNAITSIVEDPKGSEMLSLMVTGGGRGKPVALDRGNYYNAGNFILDFESGKTFAKPTISLYLQNNKLYMKHNMPLSYLKMADRSKGELAPNDKEVFNKRTLYTTKFGSFVLRKYLPHAVKKVITNPNAKLRSSGLGLLRFSVDVDGKKRDLSVYFRDGVEGDASHVNIDGVDVYISFGAKEIKIPFQVKLLKFQLDRYPGSMSPASYASEVEVIDKANNFHEKYRIYMNHVLEYRGYRFFQSSYDMDEGGTVLSVNHDPGTVPTYIGYALLALGMFWALFSKKFRFARLSKKAKDAAKAKAVPALLAMGVLLSMTPSVHAESLDPSIKTILSFDKAHTKKFSQLIVQDMKGRMKPIDTLALEVLAKIHRSATLKVANKELSADQVLLGMMMRPDIYRDIKLIRTGNEHINKILGIAKDAKYASFAQFFQNPDNTSGYKLMNLVDEASRKAPKDRDRLDKAALKIDEKVNVVYMVFTGSLLRIWPKPNDVNNKWYATIEALKKFSPQNSERVRALAVNYFSSVDASLKSGNWSKSNEAVDKIVAYQKKYGAAVYPKANKIKAEIFYNHSNIFEILWPLYFIVGFVLLILSFIKILKPRFKMAFITKSALGLLGLFFIAHTLGLALRWYISGHAPWSNGFESMTYIAWATVLAGFIFSKQSPITLASTSILAGLILFVAHLSWMNPQITNLVPVLNSYWLSIHVSMITASYGFLALGALLGFITLLLFIAKNEKNEKQISLSIKELNAINEMSLMIGLAMLTVGNFLGGVWANESWGRYWSWDPKETWALVTIIVYAVVLHLRFIKSIYNDFNYSVISLMAFTSVLMTYFGVNYYLAGMHSYAKGDPVPIPDFVPISYAIVFVIIIFAFRNRKLA